MSELEKEDKFICLKKQVGRARDKSENIKGGTDADTDPLYQKIGKIQGDLEGAVRSITNIEITVKEIKIELSELKIKIETLGNGIIADKLADAHQELKDKSNDAEKKRVEKTSRFRWLVTTGIGLAIGLLTYLIAIGKIKLGK